MTRWIVDTGPLVAFLDKDDKYHDWSRQQFELAPVPMVTCEAVVAEVAYLVAENGGKREWVLELLDRGVIELGFQLSVETAMIAKLLRKYSDSGMDLADACLVRMSERYKDCFVLTLDTDFRIYRRFQHQVIPHSTSF